MSERSAMVQRLLRFPFLKAFSLVVAILLVWMVRQDTIREVEIRVPIHANLPAKGALLLEEPPKEIRLRLRGPWSRLVTYLQRTPETFVVDLGDLQGGSEYEFIVEALEEHLDMKGARILAIYPPSFDVRIDTLDARTLSVRPNVQGRPSQYVFVDYAGIEVAPPTVTITGPMTVLDEIEELSTRPVDITGLETAYETRVEVAPPPGDLITIEPSKVRVLISLRDKHDVKALADVPIRVVDCPAGFTCRAIPERFSVRISGTERLLVGITRANVGNHVWLDAGGIQPPPGNLLSEVYGPVQPVIREGEGLRFELDEENRYFKIKLRRRRAP
ncbi:MAG: YbbR-like domain-containing protein [Pseudomonadota bacterium]